METIEAGSPGEDQFSYRAIRKVNAFGAAFARLWDAGWARRLLYVVGALALGVFAFWYMFARGLPDAAALAEYEPALPSVVRDVNGEPIYSYARERRVQLQFDDYPPLLIHSYLAAEDKTFFSHHGIDFPGLAGAVFDYITKIGSGQRAKGGSTITQQVAKNLLIGDEYSPTRKIKEMILAYRIENAMTKQQILELYLNQIFLGRNAYGVQAAAQAYFGKDVDALALHEIAYLAILPKGPSNYRPEVHEQRAISRRNWVLGEMRDNGWITATQFQNASAQPLGAISGGGVRFERVGGYFIEEVRRQLIEQFGENEKAGPYSVYSGGLWVRTSLNPELQEYTKDALPPHSSVRIMPTGRSLSPSGLLAAVRKSVFRMVPPAR